uniref:alpha-N-acetylgalactosaminide alpha-2,6-sialyltransferase n=1 Tax=Sphaeramia orbicularis TaxID=375764 RepID=A0A672YB49_9TELE
MGCFSSSEQTVEGSTELTWTKKTTEEEQGFPPLEACPLRSAVQSDVLLRSRFRFSVPVLQWVQSFSASSLTKLNQRAPPYGWKGLPVDDVRSTLLLLNSPHLFTRTSPERCVRCAVVGNGGILRGSKKGKEIDDHDFVFRMNGAMIKGFEEDVGTKTSFYGFTTNTLKNALILYRRDGFTRIPQNPSITYVFIPSNLRDYLMISAAIKGRPVASGRDKGDKPWMYFGHKPSQNFKILHPDFFSSPLLHNIRTKHLYMPSTGALMLMTALHTCDQVSAYGFITKDFASYSDHYFDSVKKPLQFFANHDMKMELRVWASLHDRKVLTLYQGQT